MSRGRLLQGTLVLTAAGVIVKIMGAIYRIPLTRTLGEEGIGLYQTAYPVYLVFLSFSTAGIPTAISKLIAECVAKNDFAGVRRLFLTSLGALSTMGLTGSLLMGLGARWFACRLAADARAYPVVLSLAPAVALMAVMSAFRGYFQGWQEMRPSGISQLWEQGVRVVVLLILALLLLPQGVEWAAAGAAFGATAGALAGVIYLTWKYFGFQRRLGRERSAPVRRAPSGYPWLRRLIKFSIPIAFGSVLMPLMQAMDSILVPGKLRAAGYPVSRSTAALGQLGNAWAVLYFPLIVTAALSAGLVPAVSEAAARRKSDELGARIREGYRVAAWILPPASIGLLTLGKDIYRLIFAGQTTWILAALAPGIFFLGWQQVSAAVLQGLGRPSLPLRHFGLGCVVKAFLTWFLAGGTGLGVFGAALATVAGSAVTAFLNLFCVFRLTRQKGWFQALKVPMAAAVAMGGAGALVSRGVPGFTEHPLRLAVFIPVLALFYAVLLWAGGGIGRGDLENFAKYAAGITPRGWGRRDERRVHATVD